MSQSDMDSDMIQVSDILRQETGRFDHRFKVGPAQWAFWDLLWLHEGHLSLKLTGEGQRLDITAPGGVLIPPGTPFRGTAVNGAASASIAHFTSPEMGDNVLQVPVRDRMHAMALIQLSLDYALRGEPMERRIRLLMAILDCFATPAADAETRVTRLDRTWREATAKLAEVRGVADVAAFAGLAESSFRAAHRAQLGGSAGKHLRNLRLAQAEKYLATTGFGLAEIASRVGYAHAETLAAAFKRSRGRTPGDYRRWCKRFA